MDTPTTLERCTAALFRADPSARILFRGPGSTPIEAEGMQVAPALLLEVTSLEQLHQALQTAVEALPKGKLLRAVAIGPAIPFTEAPWMKGKVAAVYLWTPGEEPKRVWGGGSFPALVKASKTDGGDDARTVIDARAGQSDEVADFMTPLLARKPVVTWSLAGLSCVLFALQEFWGSGQPYVSGLRMGASVNSLISAGEVWRLVTPMLLHGNWAHLLLNMLALFSFGTFLERYLGASRYFLLYVLSGIGGGIASFLRHDEVISVGASGGIWGLMIAGAVLVTWPRGRLPLLVSVAQRGRAWSPVAINGFYSFQPGVDALAHFGGGVVGGLLIGTGLITSGLPRPGQSVAPQLRRLYAYAASVCGLVLVSSLAVSIVTGKPWELRGTPPTQKYSAGKLGVTLVAPRLIGKAAWNEQDKRFGIGSLNYDPVAFEVMETMPLLDAQEQLEPEKTLQSIADKINGETKEATDGFKSSKKWEVRKRGEQMLVRGERSNDTGIVMAHSWVLSGAHLVGVIIYSAKWAPTEWLTAADEVPWTVVYTPPGGMSAVPERP